MEKPPLRVHGCVYEGRGSSEAGNISVARSPHPHSATARHTPHPRPGQPGMRDARLVAFKVVKIILLVAFTPFLAFTVRSISLTVRNIST